MTDLKTCDLIGMNESLDVELGNARQRISCIDIPAIGPDSISPNSDCRVSLVGVCSGPYPASNCSLLISWP